MRQQEIVDFLGRGLLQGGLQGARGIQVDLGHRFLPQADQGPPVEIFLPVDQDHAGDGLLAAVGGQVAPIEDLIAGGLQPAEPAGQDMLPGPAVQLLEEAAEIGQVPGGTLRAAGTDAEAGPHRVEPLRIRAGVPDGSLSPRRTILRNTLPALGLFLCAGRSFRRVASLADRFLPDLVISDFEPYLSRLARLRGIPLLAIDHQHFLTESALPDLRDWQKSLMLKLFQLGTFLLGGRPNRIITSSFHHFPRRRGSRAVFVGPFIPDTLRRLHPEDGEAVVVYLKQPAYLELLLPVLTADAGTSFRIFSAWGDKAPRGLPGNIRLEGIDRDRFLGALAQSRALVTTAGNQVVGEAIYLRKPVLAFPEPDVLEQELNAMALNRSGFGESFRLKEFTEAAWSGFQARIPAYRQRMASAYSDRDRLDGRGRTQRVLGRMLRGLAVPGRLPIRTHPSFS